MNDEEGYLGHDPECPSLSTDALGFSLTYGVPITDLCTCPSVEQIYATIKKIEAQEKAMADAKFTATW